METQDIYTNAFALPQGEYYTPRMAKANHANTIIVRMGNEGITNATSTKPILGTVALAACTGVGIYNKRTKTVVIDHQAEIYPETFAALVNKARKLEKDVLEVHLVGAFFNPKDTQDHEDYVPQLTELIESIQKTPNIVLKTCDIGNKPHPNAFAVDARNGNLIRGSKDFTSSDDLMSGGPDLFHHFEDLDTPFDGTQLEFQAKKRKA